MSGKMKLMQILALLMRTAQAKTIKKDWRVRGSRTAAKVSLKLRKQLYNLNYRRLPKFIR